LTDEDALAPGVQCCAAANSWSLACAQQVNYLRDARKDCAMIDLFSHGFLP
jgi:hypothetical protein